MVQDENLSSPSEEEYMPQSRAMKLGSMRRVLSKSNNDSTLAESPSEPQAKSVPGRTGPGKKKKRKLLIRKRGCEPSTESSGVLKPSRKAGNYHQGKPKNKTPNDLKSKDGRSMGDQDETPAEPRPRKRSKPPINKDLSGSPPGTAEPNSGDDKTDEEGPELTFLASYIQNMHTGSLHSSEVGITRRFAIRTETLVLRSFFLYEIRD
jgi:hypothetical protein